MWGYYWAKKTKSKHGCPLKRCWMKYVPGLYAVLRNLAEETGV
jgi:hypothetical protein